MKHVFLSGLLLACTIALFSQDIITKKNGDEIKSKVTEVGESAIKYKKADNLDGPTYNINTSEVFMIKYENGKKDFFGASTPHSGDNQTSLSVKGNNEVTGASNGSVLAAGTALTVKIKNNWSTKNNEVPEFVVANNVTDLDGNILIPGGAVITTQVKEHRARGVGRPGFIDVQYISVKAVDGQNIALIGGFNKKGENRYALCHGLTWGLFFFVLGPFSLPCLAIKGKELHLVSGDVVCNNVSLANAIKINVVK